MVLEGYFLHSCIIASVGFCSSSVDQNNWYFVTSYIFGKNQHTYSNRKKIYFVYSHIDRSVKSAKFRLLKSIINTAKGQLILKCLHEIIVWTKILTKILIVSALALSG